MRHSAFVHKRTSVDHSLLYASGNSFTFLVKLLLRMTPKMRILTRNHFSLIQFALIIFISSSCSHVVRMKHKSENLTFKWKKIEKEFSERLKVDKREVLDIQSLEVENERAHIRNWALTTQFIGEDSLMKRAFILLEASGNGWELSDYTHTCSDPACKLIVKDLDASCEPVYDEECNHSVSWKVD